MDMSDIVEPQDPSVERLARLMGDRCKAKNASKRLQTLTEKIDEARIAAEVEVFRAMADPFRLAILQLLREGELCVCEIVAALDRRQSSTSHHLSVLREAGLVRERKDGKWSYYRISDGAVLEMLKQAEVLKRK